MARKASRNSNGDSKTAIAPATAGRKYAIVVGINNYLNPDLCNLRYCVTDAEGVAAALEQHCGFEKPVVLLLNKEGGSRAKLLHELHELRDRGRYPDPGLFVFYFAGHGGVIKNDNYLIPHDGRTGGLAQDLNLSLKRIIELLRESGFSRQVMFLDACRDSLYDGTRRGRAGFSKVDVDKAVSKASGLKIFFGTEFGCVALERTDLGHGLFTHYLIEALSGRAPATDEHGKLTVTSLLSYLTTAIVNFVANPADSTQSPHTAGEGSDMIEIACFPSQPDPQAVVMRDLMALGHRLREAEDFTGARTVYEALSALDGTSAEAYYYQGVCCSSLGLHDEALASYETAQYYDPRDAKSAFNSGCSLSELGRHEDAIAAYDKALLLDPQDAASSNNKGNSLAQLGRYEESLTAYNLALRLNPLHVIAAFNKGNLLAESGMHAEAVAAYDEVLRLDPEYFPALCNKGISLAALDLHQEALSAFDAGLIIESQDTALRYNRGLSLIAMGLSLESLDAFDEVLRLDPVDIESWGGKGVSLFALDRLTEAEESFAQVLVLSEPNSASCAAAMHWLDLIRTQREQDNNLQTDTPPAPV